MKQSQKLKWRFSWKQPGRYNRKLILAQVSISNTARFCNNTSFLTAQLATAPTVIFLHGNAGNVGHRLINAKALHSFCGCNIFLLEWRGFGKSDGLASEYGEPAFSSLLSYNHDLMSRQFWIFFGGMVR